MKRTGPKVSFDFQLSAEECRRAAATLRCKGSHEAWNYSAAGLLADAHWDETQAYRFMFGWLLGVPA